MARLLRLLLPLILVALNLACGKVSSTNLTIRQPPSPAPYWPTDGWRVSTPESQGFDSAQLAELLDFIKKNNARVHSLLLIRNGQMVLDARFYPFTLGGKVHDVASVTKSVTSALIGIAIDKGYIQSVDQPVLSFFQDRPPVDGDVRKSRTTIENLLTMTSGFDCGFRDDLQELYAMLQSGNLVQAMLGLPMVGEPGSRWAYCSGNTHLLSAIITKTTGLSALDFAQQHLFGPLGIHNIIWPSDAQNLTNGYGDLHLRPQDMAKIGYLYLHGGMWEEKQIISSRWIEKTLTSHATVADNEGYGYSWYLQSISPSMHLYSASGRAGHKIYVWPSKKVIVVLTGGGDDLALIQHLLIPAVQPDSSLPENKTAYLQLQNALTEIARPPAPKPVPEMPGAARLISGKTYRLGKNANGLQTISLDFDNPEKGRGRVSRLNPHGETEGYEFLIGLDDVYAITAEGYFGLPVGAKGYWKAVDEFVLDWNLIANINHYTLTLGFEDNMVRVQIDDQTELPSETFVGHAKE